MERRIYLSGDMICERGGSPSTFYVLRNGAVYFLLNDSERKYPFMKIDSYFGEFEIFDGSKTRRWSVMAQKKCVIYTIKKLDFYKIFCEEDFYDAFQRNQAGRLRYFEAVERICMKHLNEKKNLISKMEKKNKAFQRKLRVSIHIAKGKTLEIPKTARRRGGVFQRNNIEELMIKDQLEKKRKEDRIKVINMIKNNDFCFGENEFKRFEEHKKMKIEKSRRLAIEKRNL